MSYYGVSLPPFIIKIKQNGINWSVSLPPFVQKHSQL
jgi:hypothetical protein